MAAAPGDLAGERRKEKNDRHVLATTTIKYDPGEDIER